METKPISRKGITIVDAHDLIPEIEKLSSCQFIIDKKESKYDLRLGCYSTENIMLWETVVKDSNAYGVYMWLQGFKAMAEIK